MRVLVTGGAGTLGKALWRQFGSDVEQWIIYSRDEYKQAAMERSEDRPNLRFFIGDIRNLGRLTEVLQHKHPDVVIHAAALKQIDRCEANPLECIETNVTGTANVVRACLETGVKKCIFVGSDKDTEPINLYGATKLLGEHLCHAANVYGHTKFFRVRYGNVEGSRGSLLEIIDQCRKENKPVPVTDPDMTRWWIRPECAAQLIWYVIQYATDTSLTYVPTMTSMSVGETIKATWPDAQFVKIPIREYEKKHELIVGHGEDVFLVNEKFNAHHIVSGPICSALS